MNNINRFTQGNPETVRRLNQLVDALNSINNFVGDGLIKVQRSPNGYAFSLNMDGVNARIIKQRGGSGGTQVRRAITTQAAPAQIYITANLYSESTGLEQTTGDESGISVYCSTMGANLDVCIPRLKDNTDIWVAQFNYNVSGTPTARWYMIGQVFQLVNADHLEVDATNGLQTTLFECVS